MKKSFRRIAIIAISFCLCVVLGTGLSATLTVRAASSPEWKIKVTKVGKNYSKTVKKGEKLQLTVNSGNKKLKEKDLQFTSSKKSVAIVNKKGLITTKGVGKTKITVKKTGTKEKAVITLTVKKPIIKVKSVKIYAKKSSLKIGETLQLSVKVKPTDANNTSVKWSTSDKSVLTVDSTGRISAKKVGKAKITAKAKDGSGSYGVYTFKVIPIGVSKLALTEKSVKLYAGKSVQLKASILPKNATNQDVKWNSSDKTIASVDKNGLVKAVSHGTAIITATSADNKNISATCIVSIPQYISKSGNCGNALKYTIKGYAGELSLDINGAGQMYSNQSLGWEEYGNQIQTVRIANGLTKIRSKAFSGLTSLKSITIPESCTGIETSAFEGCECLKDITLPSGLVTVGERAFADCYSIKSIALPESCRAIGEAAFENCKGLTNVVLSSKITDIPDDAFCDCNKLSKINLQKVVKVGSNAFYGCIQLKNVNLNSVVEIGYGAFGSSGLTSLVIPSTCTDIGWEAFSNSDIKSLVIPSSVEYIGIYAFKDCKSLTSLSISCNIEECGYGIFGSCKSLTEIMINEGVTIIEDNMFDGQFADLDIVEAIYIPSTLTIFNTSLTKDATVENVYYPGSEDDFNAIEGHENLVGALTEVHFNYRW